MAMKKLFFKRIAPLFGLLLLLPSLMQAETDPLAKFKLNLNDTTLCKVYYTRAGKYQQSREFTIKGGSFNGSDSIVTVKNDQLVNLTDTSMATNGSFTNQAFVVYDFGEKGIDLKQIRLSNDGYYQKTAWGNHQNTTVFGTVWGRTDTADFKTDVAQLGTNFANLTRVNFLRTNGSAQAAGTHTFAITESKWVTGTKDTSYNDNGHYTLQATGHEKYRYVGMYDWSYGWALNNVEMWGVPMKDNVYNNAQIDLNYAIAKAEVYATDFSQSDKLAVDTLNLAITSAKATLSGTDTTSVTVNAAVTTLNTAISKFMSAITYVLKDTEFFCKLTTPDGSYGLALASAKTTVGTYTGYELKVVDPSAATNFSIAKGSAVNSQQSYKLSTPNGTVIQSGATLMLVDNAQVTTANTASIVFTQRYYSEDAEMGLYDLKAGSYFYYVDGEKLKGVSSFPAYTTYEDINSYLFTLVAGTYDESQDDTTQNWKGWDFKDAAITNFDKFGKNSGQMADGWRLNKWRMHSRVAQETVNSSGYMVLSVNNPFYELADTMAQTPVAPDFTVAKYTGIGYCRESGKYASLASTDPIDQVRDSVYIEYVNPHYTPYIGVKMASTNVDSMTLATFSMSFFIKKDGVEPKLTLTNMAGKKGDVYYWKLTDCGFTVGQVGYSAQYLSTDVLKTCKAGLVIDWIKPFASLSTIPTESIPAADLTAIVATLPASPVVAKENETTETRKLVNLDLTDYLYVYDASNVDVTETNATELAKVNDKNLNNNVLLNGNYYVVVKLPEDAQTFKTMKLNYMTGATEYQTNVFFFKDALDVTNTTIGNYVWNAGSIWMKTAFSGTCVNDATNRVCTFTNTKKDKFTYVAIKADNAGTNSSMTELAINFYQNPKPLNLTDTNVCVAKAYDGSNVDVTSTYQTSIVAASDKVLTTTIGLAAQKFMVYDFGEKGVKIDSIRVHNNGVAMQTNEFADVLGDCSTASYTGAWAQASKTNVLRTNKSLQGGVALGDTSWFSKGHYAVVNPGTYRYVAFYNWSAAFNASEVEIFGTKNYAKIALPKAAKAYSKDSVTVYSYGKTANDRNAGDDAKILAWQDSSFTVEQTMGGGNSIVYDFGQNGAYISNFKISALTANKYIRVAYCGSTAKAPVKTSWAVTADSVAGQTGDYKYNGVTLNETLVACTKDTIGTWVKAADSIHYTLSTGEIGKVRYIRITEWSGWALTEVEAFGYKTQSSGTPIVPVTYYKQNYTVKVWDATDVDYTSTYAAEAARLSDAESQTICAISGSYYVDLQLTSEGAKNFKYIKVYYASGSTDYANQAYFCTSDSYGIVSGNYKTYANYIPQAGGAWGATAFPGTAVNDTAKHCVTFTNTTNAAYTHFTLRADQSWQNLTITEVEVLSTLAVGLQPVALESDAEVVSRSYYTISGVQLPCAPDKGFFIVKSLLSDGRVNVQKMILNR
jgi:hypothetical protein